VWDGEAPDDNKTRTTNDQDPSFKKSQTSNIGMQTRRMSKEPNVFTCGNQSQKQLAEFFFFSLPTGDGSRYTDGHQNGNDPDYILQSVVPVGRRRVQDESDSLQP
jgi:hypothetical protein